jgi:hypothetical protein
MLKCVSSTFYQGNGYAKSTKKVINTLITKLVNESKTNWDEHLPIVFFHIEYCTRYHRVYPILASLRTTSIHANKLCFVSH